MLHPWFVSGFCESEATFTYSKAGKGYNLYFSLRQKSENRHIIEELRRFFANSGNIYLTPSSKERGLTGRGGYLGEPSESFSGQGVHLGRVDLPRVKHNLSSFRSVYYRVVRLEELAIIIDHFDRYPLQGKKQEVYGLWRQMWLHKKEHYRDPDNVLLKRVAEQLSSLNRKGA